MFIKIIVILKPRASLIIHLKCSEDFFDFTIKFSKRLIIVQICVMYDGLAYNNVFFGFALKLLS